MGAAVRNTQTCVERVSLLSATAERACHSDRGSAMPMEGRGLTEPVLCLLWEGIREIAP